MDTWRTWEFVLPALERRHDTVALTLAGHAGGPPIRGPVSDHLLADEVERAMDAAGLSRAHIVGNSLGGHVALQLAARGRALTVVALAPAGGWARGDESVAELLGLQAALQREMVALAPRAELLLAGPDGPRRATRLTTVHYEHIPRELLAHQMLGIAACRAAPALIRHALAHEWTLDAEQVSCPVRVLWGIEDRLLPWPRAAARYRTEWLPQADWVILDDVGHCPQLDVPVEAAQLILGFTASAAA